MTGPEPRMPIRPGQPTILLVDDDAATASEMLEIVTEHGMHAIFAHNASAAIQALEAHPSIEVVITDLYMPIFDGLDLIEKANRLRQKDDIATIIVTGRPEVESSIRALRANVTDILRKPLKPAELLTSIDRALNSLHRGYDRNNDRLPAARHDAGIASEYHRGGTVAMADERRLIDPTLDILLGSESNAQIDRVGVDYHHAAGAYAVVANTKHDDGPGIQSMPAKKVIAGQKMAPTRNLTSRKRY